MNISSVSPAASSIISPVASASSVTLGTTTAAMAAVEDTAGQIQSQIDQLELEEESHATAQVAQEIQQLHEAQRDQLKQEETAALEDSGANEATQGFGPAGLLDTQA